MRSPSSAFDARLLRGAALLVSSLFLATCERGPTAPAVPTQLAFSVQPTTTTAGHQITPAVQVTALDAGGRPVPGFTQNVTVTLTAGTGTSGATLTGTTTVAAANGVATFYALTLDKSSTGYTLTATASGLSAATSARFDINPGPATHLVFTVQPGNATAGATIAPAVEVTAQDASGNTVPTFTAQVTVALGGTNPSGGTLAGTKTVAAVSGVASFATLSIDKSGSYWLTAGAGGLSGGTSSDFSIAPGPATQLAFTVQPVTTTAGHQIAPAVQLSALDALGNVVPGFTGDVTVALGGTNPSGGTLTGTTSVAAANGVAIFYALSLDKSGTGYTLTATASGLSAATSAPFDITPGAATHLVFTVQPANTTAGATLTPAVQVAAQDAAGNTVPSFTGSVTLALGGTNPAGGVLAGTTTVAAVNGVASFATLSVDKSGDYWLAARATGLSGGTSSDFSVSPGAATHLTFTVQPGTTTAGHQIAPAVKVAAQDALGNVVPSFTGSVTVALGSNPAGSTLSGSATVSAVSGLATFGDLSINTSGTGYTLTATATGLTGATSTPFGVTPGAATHLVFTVQPANATAGTTLTPAVQVAAQDAAGNTVPSFSGSVTVALGGTNPAGGTLAGTTTVAAVNGVASFATLSIDKSGSYWLTATAPATGLSGGTSNDFSIAAGAATQLAFTVQPSNAVAGRTISPAVQVSARDAQGNLVTGFVGSVTMALGTNPGGSTLGGTTTVPAVSGVASFGNLSLDKVGTGYTLTAAAAGPTGATSNSFNVTVGAASQLVFTVQPTNTTAGATITPAVQVTVLDGQGNTATGFTGNVTVAFGSNPGGGTLAGTTTVAAVSGVASFASLSIAKVGTGYTLTGAAAGLPAATSAAFNVTPGTAAKLVFTVQPSNTAAGAAITPAVQVTAQDAQGNTASGFTGTVTVGLGANPVGGTLSGHTTVAASAGVATLADLSLDRAGTGYTLTAAGGGLSGATSAAFNITVGGNPAGLHGAAEHRGGGPHDQPRGAGGRARRAGEPGECVRGQRDGGARDQSQRRHPRGDDDGDCGGRRGDVRHPERRQGGDRLHARGDGPGAQRGDQQCLHRHRGSGDPVRLQRAAERHGRGGRDHARRPSDGAGRGGQCGDGVCGVGGGRLGDESERRHAGGDDDGAGGEWGGELRQPEPQQGGQRLHPDGGGAVPTGAHGGDERPLRHLTGTGGTTAVHSATDEYHGGGGDYAGRAGDGPGRAGEYGHRVQRQRDGGARSQRQRRHALGHHHGGGGRRGRDLRGSEPQPGRHRLHADRGRHGGGQRDERGVRRRRGGGGPPGVHRAAGEHDGRRGDRSRRASDGAGRAGEHGAELHGQRHGGARQQPGGRDVDGNDHGGGDERGGELRELEHRPGRQWLHPDGSGDGSNDREQRRVQYHAGHRGHAAVHGPAEQCSGGGGDRPGRPGRGARRPRKHRNRVQRQRHHGPRGESRQRDARRHYDRGSGERRGHVREPEHQQGRHGIHAHRLRLGTDGCYQQPLHCVGRGRDAAGVHRAAD